MPLRTYLLTHPDARLTEAELSVLADGLTTTFGGEGGGDDERQEEEEDD